MNKPAVTGAKEFRVALNTSVPFDQLDTADIRDAADYSILELLFSCLVEYDNNGQIIPGIAKTFYWDKNDLVFEFRETSSSSGRPITPHDALITLKRLMLIKNNSHGDLFHFLRMDQRPRELADSCSGIEVSGSRLILKAKSQNPFIIPLLTIIDYAIIPEHCIDKETKRIVNLHDTSGPYRRAESNSETILVANGNHWHYRKNMPQKVQLLEFDYDGSSEKSAQNLFLRGELDYIPTASGLTVSEVEGLRKKSTRPCSIHVTSPMFLSYAQFTQTGLCMPVEKRRQLVWAFSRGLNRHLADDPDQKTPTFEIFPRSFFGSLTNQQLDVIHSAGQEFTNPFDAEGIRIALPDYLIPFYQQAFQNEVVHLEFVKRQPMDFLTMMEGEKIPELSVVGVDVTSHEDINSISYLVKNEILSPPNDETPDEWLRRYFQTVDKSQRESLLQKIHFNTIWENPSIIPLSMRPFASIITNEWQTDFSRISPNDPFWKIKSARD